MVWGSGDDAIALLAQILYCIGGRGVALDIYPLICSECDVEGRQKRTQILDRMDVLHTKRLAVAHNGAGILCVEHILGHNGQILGAHIERSVERVDTTLQQERGEIFVAFTHLVERELVGR